MKGLLSLGIKNLRRYRRRTLITAVAVAMGLMMFIMMDSMLRGANQESEINILRFETASGRVVTPEYWDDHKTMPIKEVLPLELLADLEESTLSWAPRIEFSGDLIFRKSADYYPEDGSVPAMITAVDPLREGDVLYNHEHLVSGRYIEADEDGAVIGSWLAEDMGIEVGYPLDILVSSRFGGDELMELEVVGIVETPNPIINRNLILIPLVVADDYLEMDGQVTQVVFSLNGEQDQQRLDSLLEPYNAEFYTWQEWAADFIAIAEGKQTSSSSILFLVFIIAAVGISNTVLMSIFERVRELGMMRAMGMTERDIRRMFVYEAAGIGLLGGAIGVVWGALVNVLLVNKGLDYSALLRDMDVGYRMASVLYGVWNWPVMITAFFAGAVMCVTIAWLSTRKINRMPITACLRYQ